eukprot:3675607-Amphidinium_carterae.1
MQGKALDQEPQEWYKVPDTQLGRRNAYVQLLRSLPLASENIHMILIALCHEGIVLRKVD